MQVLFYVFLFLWTTTAESNILGDPNQGLATYYSSSANWMRPPKTSDKNGVGLNRYGFHVSAGVRGGWLAENGSPGGPHAEASTPFGLSAAGEIGIRNEKDKSILYAYVDAQLGSLFPGVCLLVSSEEIKLESFRKCAIKFNLFGNGSSDASNSDSERHTIASTR